VAAACLLGIVVIILLTVNTMWMVQLRALLQTHASQTDTESSHSLTSTMNKIRTTLLIFYCCGIVAIASVVYHAIADQQPYQWMISWWLPRICCFVSMCRLVVFYRPDHKPDEPKITRLSCHSPPSRTSSATRPSPVLASASSNNLENLSEPPVTPSRSSNSGGLKHSPLTHSLSGRKLDVPSVDMGQRKLSSVLSMLSKEQGEDLTIRSSQDDGSSVLKHAEASNRGSEKSALVVEISNRGSEKITLTIEMSGSEQSTPPAVESEQSTPTVESEQSPLAVE